MARPSFFLRKLHSLSGVVPVGVFLVAHLWTNATALRGRPAFDGAVGEIQAMPFLPVVEVLGIFLPLAFHAFYGIFLLRQSGPNVVRYPFARNWLYVAQRASGLVAFAFIVFHLWEFRLQKLLHGMRAEAFYDTLVARLSSLDAGVPLHALVYLVGIGASVFHLANGLWGFGVSWGILVSRPAQRRAAWAAFAFGAALFFVGAETTLHFATGAAPFFAPSDSLSAPGAPPCPPEPFVPIRP